jgi:hypothetical protein
MKSMIGSIAVNIIRGVPPQLRYRVDTWQVPGIDGYGAMNIGLGDAEFDLLAIVYCDSNDDANGLIVQFTQLQGTIITVFDDFGDEYVNILPVHVDTVNCKTPCIWYGDGQLNANAVRLEVKLKCLTTNPPSE